jgi:hypothetical protein
MQEEDEEEDSDSGDEEHIREAKRFADSDEMWSGPRAEAGTLEELEEMLGATGILDGSDEDESEESEDDNDNALSLKMVAPPVEESEPVKQLSKKEQKRLEDEAFERELAEALNAVGAPALAPAADASAASAASKEDKGGDGGDTDSSSSKKKKKKKNNKKKGGGDGEAAAAPAAAPAVELTPMSEEDIAKAKEALAAKIKDKAAKKAQDRKQANGAPHTHTHTHTRTHAHLP